MDCQREARRLFRLALRLPTREQSHPGHQVQQQGVAERLRFLVVPACTLQQKLETDPGRLGPPLRSRKAHPLGLVASDPGPGVQLPLGRRPSIDNYRFYFPDLPARDSELMIFVLPRLKCFHGNFQKFQGRQFH